MFTNVPMDMVKRDDSANTNRTLSERFEMTVGFYAEILHIKPRAIVFVRLMFANDNARLSFEPCV